MEKPDGQEPAVPPSGIGRSTQRGGPGRALPHLALAALLVLLAVDFLARSRLPDTGPAGPPDNPAYSRGEAAFLRGNNLEAARWFRESIEQRPLDVRAYRDLVDAHSRLGSLEEAEAYLRTRRSQDPENPCLAYALGKVQYRRSNLQEAERYARLAVRERPRLGWSYLLLGLVRHSSGDPQEALRCYDRARRIFRDQRDEGGAALALNNAAGVLLDLNEPERALAAFREVRARQRSLGRKAEEVIALGNVGLTEVQLGRCREALETLQEGLVLARALGDRVTEWKLHEYICYAHRRAGDYHAALQSADSIIVVARAASDPLGEVAGRMQSANLWNDLGDPPRALAACDTALVTAEAMGHARYRVDLLLLRSEAQMLLGRTERAREGYALCDSLARSTGLGGMALRACAALCRIALRQGDTTGARATGERALSYGREISSREGEALISGELAEVFREEGEPGRALPLADRSVELQRESGSRIDLARALALRARLRLDLRDLPGARRDGEEGLRLSISMNSPEARWECEMVLGDVLGSSDPKRALQHYASAMEAVESTRQNLRRQEYQAGYLADRIEIYFKTAELLIAEGRTEDALLTCERSRARALRDLLGGAGSRPAPIPASGASAAEIARALPPGTALLEYFLGPRSSLCFLVRDGRVELIPLAASARELTREVEALRAPLEAPRSLTTLTLDLSGLRALAARILDPVWPHLRGVSALIIVPDGPLHLWPFEALPVPGNGAPTGASAPSDPAARGTAGAPETTATPVFLGDVAAVVYLPASRLLTTPAGGDGSARPLARQGSVLALGYAGGAAAPAFTRELPQRRSPGPRGDLRLCEEEAETVARCFPGGMARTGTDATERCFKESAGGYRYLHVSSHALADAVLPLYSGLDLAPDAAGKEDGFLHAYEILALPLTCDLVTLSACQTACGRLYAGEGVLGLTSALLSAGARQVLVSLWSVNDASTEILMNEFYDRLREGLPPEAALREAKRSLRLRWSGEAGGHRISYAHPFFWAPFVLIGRGPGV